MAKEKKSSNFIEQIIEKDLNNGFSKEQLRLRFPPEPNGYLHIGHSKAICLNFGLGSKYKIPVNLRFDDTNPEKEDQKYVDMIKKDIQWLGFKWDKEKYTSDYFEQLYKWAIKLIKKGKAYIDTQSSQEIAKQKGTPTQAGKLSPHRDRSIEDNLDMFEKMKDGLYPEGYCVLRAKIDMASTNMHMRDPVLYRIIHKSHHRTGKQWNIYPMYDWAHGQSDYIERVSHSLCSLEFQVHRELYDWCLDQIIEKDCIAPKQIEFARLNLNYTVMSKRKLLKLVEGNYVKGWDDPRMPTISGYRRRGYTPESIRNFCDNVGIAKRDNTIDVSLLEFHIREYLNKVANRVMAVLNYIKLVIINYPENKEEWLTTHNNPENEKAGSRKVPFSRNLFIEREDFKEEADSKFFRLTLGKEVRLKSAYIIKGESVVRDKYGEITEIHCTYDPNSKSGSGTKESKRKVKGTIHWVSIAHAKKAEVRLYSRLFIDEHPEGHKDKDFIEFINPNSLKIIQAYVEPGLEHVKHGESFQFQRKGYFCVDPDSTDEKKVFNLIVNLKDPWLKKQK